MTENKRTHRLLSLVLAVIFALAMPLGALAQPDDVPDTEEVQYSFELIDLEYEEAEAAELDYLDFSIDDSGEGAIDLQEIPEESISRAPTDGPSTRATVQTTSLVYQWGNTLTASNPMDIVIFTLSSPSTLVFRPVSTNTDYVIELYSADLSTGYLYPTGAGAYFGTGSASNKVISGAPAGDYAWVISSTGSVGASYALYVNATLPGDISNVAFAGYSPDLSDIYTVTNNKYYLNGSAMNLDLKYEVQQFWGTGWHHRRTYIENVNVDNVALHGYGTFSYVDGSTLHKYDNVLFLRVYPGVKWTSLYDVNPHYGYTPVYNRNYDMSGRLTPRVMDEQDVAWHQTYMKINFCGYLVYDLNTKKSVEYFSSINYHMVDDVNFYDNVEAVLTGDIYVF